MCCVRCHCKVPGSSHLVEVKGPGIPVFPLGRTAEPVQGALNGVGLCQIFVQVNVSLLLVGYLFNLILGCGYQSLLY